MAASLAPLFEEWETVEKNLAALEEQHKTYSRKVEDVKARQAECVVNIQKQRKVLAKLADSLKKAATEGTDEEKQRASDITDRILEYKSIFRDMEEILPHENGIYLKVILGSVNVSLLSKKDKFKYKENYEQFKFYVTVISMVLAVILWFTPPYRVLDAAYEFLLVWYYCTLTIREHILKVNGSRIKGWWITHHFISTLCAGILLIWPEGYTYHVFRNQFFVFCMYTCLVQIALYYYQLGCLYRLRALGERRNMDITVEGFMSYMWQGMSFVLPFLVLGYLFQLYNAYVLYNLALHPKCIEWQVQGSAYIFFVLFLGNTLTIVNVIRQKIKREGWMQNLDFVLTNKYRFRHQHGSNSNMQAAATEDPRCDKMHTS